jgi:predicted TIM-barrel fold metal-dependent hydrolase
VVTLCLPSLFAGQYWTRGNRQYLDQYSDFISYGWLLGPWCTAGRVETSCKDEGAYGSDLQVNFEVRAAANQYVAKSADSYPNRIIPAGWTDPKALGLEGALKLAETCVQELGFPLVKMNPAQNAFPIDSPEVMTVLDRIVELGAVPAFHFGADTIYTPATGLQKVAQRHPDHPLVAVHMGGGGAAVGCLCHLDIVDAKAIPDSQDL